ncbi:hypothetical protein A1QO_00665 [Vibrio genomosp. F10 str. ZF-129]|uniref:Uncharacterized protein n=1 Tax=Vibrio genomosp. F10 str. ZF-129 TaxID=1187848 RepID=A0A1E5BGA5_9VIBR|nr:hypothetical protein [Vibrio genomosp. F10]OEE35304.1 hypothetical protein A1QO_00665 [Vibrio genomosp. F10 str. ZF-129]
MLNKKLFKNSFELCGIVSEESDALIKLSNNGMLINIEHNFTDTPFMVGSNIQVFGTYSYEDRLPIFRASSIDFIDSPESLNGQIEGVVKKLTRMGTKDKPWAKVLLDVKHHHAFRDPKEVTSSICLVNLSQSSLESIGYDLYEGDVLGCNVHSASNDVELTLKVSKIFLHYPKHVLDYFHSSRYTNARLKEASNGN